MSTIKSSDEHLTLNADGSGNDIKFQSNGTEVASISDAGKITATNFAANADDLEIQSSTGEKMIKCVKDAQVNLYYDNSKKLATSSTGITVTGGVALGGTGSANTLDDYEEGTWTPTLTGTSGGPSGVNFNIRKAFYTKIGRQVNVSCYIGMTSWSSGPSGHAQVIGLPFAASNETTYFTTVTPGYTLNFDTDNAPGGGFIEQNTSAMRLIRRASDAARNNISTNVSGSALNGTETIIASATYFTDS